MSVDEDALLNVWDVFFRRPVTDADVDREIGRMRGGT